MSRVQGSDADEERGGSRRLSVTADGGSALVRILQRTWAPESEGGEKVEERLGGKAEVDTDTARRLFTLMCVLHFGGW